MDFPPFFLLFVCLTLTCLILGDEKASLKPSPALCLLPSFQKQQCFFSQGELGPFVFSYFLLSQKRDKKSSVFKHSVKRLTEAYNKISGLAVSAKLCGNYDSASALMKLKGSAAALSFCMLLQLMNLLRLPLDMQHLGWRQDTSGGCTSRRWTQTRAEGSIREMKSHLR